jgi:hypothetical protein
MKIIWNPEDAIGNRITSIAASDSDTSYPDENLLDENVGLLWQSSRLTGVGDVTLTFSCPHDVGSTTVIAVFGINGATSASIAASYTISGTPHIIEAVPFDLHPSSAVYYDRIWAEYTGIYLEGVGTTIDINYVVTLSGGTLYSASEVVGGEAISFPDPQYGLSQSRVDKSIKQELAGGGYYIHDANKPRTFNLSWLMTRDDEFEDLDSLYNVRGSKPLAMLISEALNDDRKWCGYFHMTDAPNATHDMPSHSAVSLSLREAC